MQNSNLPYVKVPESAENYSTGIILSQMLDGLRFRYHHATKELRAKDSLYKPKKDTRTMEEILDHILGLSQVVVNSALRMVNGKPQLEISFEEKRKKTLENVGKTSQFFRKSDDLSKLTIVFKRGERTTEFPFWNQLNSPINNTLWHVGQVVSFRRSSGNSFPKRVNVFSRTKN